MHLYLTLNYGTASEHLDFDSMVLYNAFVLSWGLTITQNSIRRISDLDRSRLSDTRSAENDRIGADADPEYRIDASLPHTIRDAGFWTECWKVSLLFSPEDTASVISIKNVKLLDDSDHRTLFHFETVYFKWALAHRTRRRFWTMFTYGFLFAWQSFSWHLQMARRIVFTDNGFWKYFWAHLVMSMIESCRWVMQCRLRARRPRASNKGLRPCPLHTEIFPVSLNLLMMLCTVDDEISKAFAIWRRGTLFLKYSTIFLHTLSQIGEPLPIFTSERLCLSKTSLL